MMMPIVSMNKMAMNESVASTCCYREVATPTAVYWEALHGGWIGNGYVNTRTPVNTNADAIVNGGRGWSAITRDFDTTAGGIGTLIGGRRLVRMTLTGDAPDNADDWQVYTTGGDLVSGGLRQIMADLGVGFVGPNPCNHTDDTCTYYVNDIEYARNQHFDSVAAHDSDRGNWRVPHTASAFAS